MQRQSLLHHKLLPGTCNFREMAHVTPEAMSYFYFDEQQCGMIMHLVDVYGMLSKAGDDTPSHSD